MKNIQIIYTLYTIYMDDQEEDFVGTLPARDFIHAEQIEHVKHSDDLHDLHGQLGCFATGSVVDERHRISIVKPVWARS